MKLWSTWHLWCLWNTAGQLSPLPYRHSIMKWKQPFSSGWKWTNLSLSPSPSSPLPVYLIYTHACTRIHTHKCIIACCSNKVEMKRSFVHDNQLAVWKIVMLWISTAPPFTGAFNYLVHLRLSSCRWITDWRNENSLDLSRMFVNAGKPCFHPSSIEVSRLCMHFVDGYAYSRCQQQVKREE